tara:strand:- start:1857 stop:2645 length:789 start_codon:yes stop_codon:yes gene_type:complete
MKKILVTGANGQLGQCFQKIREDFADLRFTFVGSAELDITNVEAVIDLFSKGQFDYCINGAAFTNVEEAEKHPEKAFLVNAEGIKNIAEACKRYQTTLIHISTDYVFDGEKLEPYTVNDIPNPINAYGRSKLKGEEYIQQLLNKFFIIRTSWLYSEFGHNFYKTILKKATAGETLTITDTETGCPTNANNVAKYILELVENNMKSYGIQHFTDNKAMTWYSFAREILKKNGLDRTTRLVRDNNYCSFAMRPKNSVLFLSSKK